jgi:hypothetical protein
LCPNPRGFDSAQPADELLELRISCSTGGRFYINLNMPFDDVIDAVNSGPFGSTVTNFAAVRKAGAVLNSAGEKDFTKSNPEEISGTTMFCEGSIGKVRYAGMAYMLQEEGVIDLQKMQKNFLPRSKLENFWKKNTQNKLWHFKLKSENYFLAIQM